MMKKIFSALCALGLLVSLSAQLPQISLVQLATGYSSPIDIKSCGDQRLFVVEQAGYIRILYKDGTKQTTPFLDIDARVNSSGNEQGLLGLAFSPNYKQDGYFYVNYTDTGTIFSPTNSTVLTRISRFSVMVGDSSRADPSSEVILLQFPQPYSNHNGGNMMFGPDGYLYVSQGDGGSGNDPQGNGQNLNTYHGKMLRIDVTNQTSYVVPASNPFVGVPNTRPEIWSYGLRNPWRASFDRITGDMWIGDVGQDNWEEIDFQDASSAGGENYGWRCREGLHACPGCNQSGCSGPFVDPIYEVPQNAGTSCSITGGYVYRGTQYSKLFGLYLFTDYCSGNFWSIKRLGFSSFDVDTLQDFSNFQYTSFGQDNFGELYIAFRCSTTTCGKIFRIAETSDCKPKAFISFEDSVEGCSPVQLTALRGDTLSYQWYNSGGSLNGATSPQYAATQSGWYKVKVSKQQVGCESMSDSIYVTVYDTTALTVANPFLITCVNSSNLNLLSNVSPSGGLFTGSGVSGNSFSSANGNIGNNLITYAYTNTSGCASTGRFTVVLSDTSVITRNSMDTLICITESPFIMNNYTGPVGGDFSGNGVVSNSFNPALAGVGASAITYTFTNIAGCESRYAFNLVVGDSSALTAAISDSVYCNTQSAVSLNGFIAPSGGTFSGAGVSSNNFDPAGANVGANSITYTYTNSYGCLSTVAFDLYVSTADALSFSIADSVFCDDAAPVSLTPIATPTGGTFSGNGVNGNNFNPASASVGYNTIVYQYTNNSGCESIDSFSLRVDDCTGINEQVNEIGFSIYPNPSSGNFVVNLNLTETQEVELLLFDVHGKICVSKKQKLEAGSSQMTVEAQALTKGVYTVQVKAKETTSAQTLIFE